jgi:8-oxo-dGTP diphosphatase
VSGSRLPRVGSAALVINDDRVLLGRRNKEPNRGRWVLPGGGVEPFETVADAVKREVREETGLVVDLDGQLGVFEIIVPDSEHRVIVYNWARPISGDLKASSDLSELRFVSRDELAEMDLTPVVHQVLVSAGWLSADPTFPVHPRPAYT